MLRDEELKNSKILVVDDEPVNSELLVKVLQANGYSSIWSTASPHEAVDMYRKIRPDLVLLDLRMPGMDGFQVLEEFCNLERDSYPPVIMLTAETSQELRLSALKAGAKDFLSKPLDLTEVLYRCRNLLEIRFLHNKLLNHSREMEHNVMERTAELRAANNHLILEIKERVKAQSRLQKQNTLLENISEGLSLENFLTLAKSGFKDIDQPGMAILLGDEEGAGLRYGVSTGLPCDYKEVLKKAGRCLSAGCFGRSAETGKTVIVENLEKVQTQNPVDESAMQNGICSIWSTPIFGKDSRVLGIFILYPGQIRSPEPDELELFQSLAHLAGIVIARNEADEKILNMYHQLVHSEKLSAIGRLAASICHEFNNPIMGVRNVLDQIGRENILDKELQKLTLLARDECERVMGLATRLRDFYKPSQGEPRYISLAQVVDDMLLLVERQLVANNIAITRRFEQNLPPVRAIDDQIKQVVMNLLQNAMDAVPETGGEITISLHSAKGRVELVVEDNGVGIAPEHLKEIFDPFFTTKSEVRGTGLGLSVSYGIIKGHGGTIECNSRPGEGALFKVIFPVEGWNPKPDEENQNAGSKY